MWRLYRKKKVLDKYIFIIEEENRNIEICLNNLSLLKKELISKSVKKMRGNIENDWKEIKSF
jgi:hypothetical protein